MEGGEQTVEPVEPVALPEFPQPGRWVRWPLALVFFAATAAIVIWQYSRITVLYDLSGVLEPAYRMSFGDRPYLDFPFPYAPLTFLIQAALIRLGGTVYWHHIAYAAVVAGLAAAMTWLLVLRLMSGRLQYASVAASFLSLPAVVLGVYCIFPHPFYDPDACFAILLTLSAILWCERRGFPALGSVGAGFVSVVPLFI